MLYQLNNTDGESLGLVKFTEQTLDFNPYGIEEELLESWEDYHVLTEHGLDPNNVDEFVEWHNENWVTRVERAFITEINV